MLSSSSQGDSSCALAVMATGGVAGGYQGERLTSWFCVSESANLSVFEVTAADRSAPKSPQGRDNSITP